MILVSCIITTRNRLDLLQRAVNSVLTQTYESKELIIVDDGSTDGTQEWCESLISEKDGDIKYIRIAENESRGGNYARNLGIKSSSGEYIAFLDDDDEWLPMKLSRQIAVMENTPECVLVYGNRIIENVDKNGNTSYKEFPLNPAYCGDVSKKILTAIFTTTSLIMIRRTGLDKVGLFDEDLRFWQEYELSIRLAQVGSFLFVDEPLIRYRVNTFDPNRLTNRFFEWKKAVKYVRKKHRDLYDNLSFFESYSSKALIWEDASHRTRTCGKNLLSKRYRMKYKIFKVMEALNNGTFLKKVKNRLNKI